MAAEDVFEQVLVRTTVWSCVYGWMLSAGLDVVCSVVTAGANSIAVCLSKHP